MWSVETSGLTHPDETQPGPWDWCPSQAIVLHSYSEHLSLARHSAGPFLRVPALSLTGVTGSRVLRQRGGMRLSWLL